MDIDLCFTAQELNPSSVDGKIVIILDVFRTSATIITALKQGATKIIPCSTPLEALRLKKEKPIFLLGGELNSQKVTGFDLGNSPREYTADFIRGKTIILSSTNGIPALQRVKKAAQTYIGSFLNAPALVQKLIKDNHDLFLVCVGTQGKYALEDTCCAGYFLHLLQNNTKPFWHDRTLSALALYQHYQKNLPYYLSHSQNGRNLLAQGYWYDLEYCCTRNSLDTIPQYSHGVIQALN